MKCDRSTVWDDVANKALMAKRRGWLAYYMGNSFKKAIERALKCISIDANKINLLKTDLWNEGIETEQDIISQYQNDENFDLYGVDISYVTCSSAQKRADNIGVMQGDIRNLPFKGSSFHVVLDLSTLDHIPACQAERAIKEYKRVLKKEGVLVLAYTCDSTLLRLLFKLRRVKYRQLLVGSTQYYFPVNLVEGWVRNDFDILEEFSIGSLVNIAFLLNISERMTGYIKEILPESIANWVLDVEYSRISKWLLGGFAGLHAIIASRK